MGDVLLVGWDDVSASDATATVCPRLAAFRATAFEVQAFSHPVCSQSRQAILFGSYGKKIGTWQDIGSIDVQPWTPAFTLPTLPLILRGAGFQTCLVGKWHCGPAPADQHWAFAPYARGYDEWKAGTRLNLNSLPSTNYTDWQRVDASGTSFAISENTTQYATLAQLQAASEWWQATPKKRFMHVAFNAPHGPLHAEIPEELLAGWEIPPFPSARQKFQAMLRSADTAFGQLLDLVGPDTAVFLYSDNGTSGNVVASGINPDHAKETTFDPGTRVLTVARWGNNPIGLFPQLSHLVDLAAGVCAAAGVAPSSLWDSKTTPRTYTLSEAELSSGDLDRCVRTAIRKLRQVTPVGGPMGEELYDLVTDPLETTPLDLADPAEAQALAWLRGKLLQAAL